MREGPPPIMVGTVGDLRHPSMYATHAAWQPAFHRAVPAQMALYAQAAFRDAFVHDVALRNRHHLWRQTRVLEVHHPALALYVGKTIEDIAALQGKRPVDAYLDLAIADQLQSRFQTALFNDEGAGVERLITDDRFLIGLSDGGAHVDVLCDAGYPTTVLDIWVRQRQALTLERDLTSISVSG